MIRVVLGKPPAGLLSKAVDELGDARAHFGDPPKKGKFTFKAYKLKTVKDALNSVFFFKCAYCESYFGATQPLDVEHFRPKSGVLVDGALESRLYYWLAGSWDNLLPSCTDCNRPRKQRLPDGTEITLGKANQFPIASESDRAKNEGDEKRESRLLVHPAKDQPDRHFEFDTEEGMVVPTSRKGRESVRVYALLRDGLVRARKEKQVEIRVHITQARRLARKLERDGPDPDLTTMLVEELDALKRYAEPQQPYSAMARRMVDPVLEELMP
jgi:5-methylcytosine-specific restriction endonuclease McrA